MQMCFPSTGLRLKQAQSDPVGGQYNINVNVRQPAVCIATDVFGECYSNSEDRAYALLVRRTHCWSKSTVLNLATEADAKSFFAHDGVQVRQTHVGTTLSAVEPWFCASIIVVCSMS